MRKLKLIGIGVLIGLIISIGFARADEKPRKNNEALIALIKSDTVVTGLVYFKKPSKTRVNSAIVNDSIVYQGKSYTVHAKGKLLLRTKKEEEQKAPKVTILNINKAGVKMRCQYQDTKDKLDFTFVKPLKKRVRAP